MTLAMVWNGSRWRAQRTPDPAGAQRSALAAVSCWSTGGCLAVGSYVGRAGEKEPLAERRIGNRWMIERIARPGGSEASSLSGVSCLSGHTCFAVGVGTKRGPLIERWDGERWSLERSPKAGALTAVSCTSPTGCMAVGSFKRKRSGFEESLVEQRSSSGWHVIPVPRPKYAFGTGLAAVSCTSGRACTAVGSSFSNCGQCLSVNSFAETWDGTKWSPSVRGLAEAKADREGGTPSLTGVSCATPDACTAIGPARDGFSGILVTFASRWNGNSWRRQRTVSAPGGSRREGGTLHGVSCSAPTACIAVGAFDVLPPGGQLNSTLAERWNGARWSVLPTPRPPDDAGTIEYTAGLNAVSCTSPRSCIAVGSFADASGFQVPLAEHWDGSIWTLQATPRTPAGGNTGDAVLLGVSCASATACTAVGYVSPLERELPLVERWNGTNWSIQEAPAPPDPSGSAAVELSAVSCPAALNCLAVGSVVVSDTPTPFTELWDGSRWTMLATPNPLGGGSLNSVSCAPSASCIAVGSSPGPILAERWDGSSWAIQSTPRQPSGSLGAVSCSSASSCVALGSVGAATLAGNVWTIDPAASGAPGGLLDLSCSTATACIGVGGENSGADTTPPVTAQYS